MEESSESTANPSKRRRKPKISSVGDKELTFKLKRVEAEVVVVFVRETALSAKDEPGSNSSA